MISLKEELESRWLLYQTSNEKLFELYENWWETFYCGFDPTADSLHLWNFIGFMVSIHIMRRWNKYIALTGWATGMIWDPGWKDTERTFLSEEDLDNNQSAISEQITGILNKLENFTWEEYNCDFVNNKDFYKDMWYLDFLREVWKYITINNMISKDTVKKRVEDPKQSISYTEFSYMLLQWYDFSRLYNDKWLKLQIWGQDQWWNLVTGTEIIRKKYDAETYVLTWPLITDATGRKFGKSEWNALWLNKDKTSVYELYQYFMNTNDEDISKYLKMLTLIDVKEIDEKVKAHLDSPEKREWQKLLSYKVVEIIHWSWLAELALKISNIIFWGLSTEDVLKTTSKEDMIEMQKELWGFKYESENLFETIVKSWLAPSNSEARNSIKSSAISINEEKISDFNFDFSASFNKDWFMFIKKWKKNFKIISK